MTLQLFERIVHPIKKNYFRIKNLFIFTIYLKANHNKDYSVVKTFKAAQVAFFFKFSFMLYLHQYKQILSQQKEQLLKAYPIKTLGLFGSVVRNDFTQSDIDVIVEFTRPVGMEFIELADDLEKILQRKVDLVSRKGLREKTFDFIKEEIQYV
jgi:uncharacterized protein